ncbi:MAG: hypothetical protein V3V88_03565 [Dehalococcoidia bacterium]
MSVTGKTEVKALVLDRGIIFADNSEPKQGVFEVSTTQEHLLGTELRFSDGRQYRYARAGATALTKNLMCQKGIDDADYNAEDQTGNFPVIGDTTIVVEVATGLALIEDVNELAGGVVVVNAGLDAGSIYNITGSKFGTTDTNIALTIDSPIRITWDTTSNITIVPNMWMNTLVHATTTTGSAVGVPNVDVPINNYYWSQTGGPCGLVCDATETIGVGGPVGAPAAMAVAGRVGLNVTVTQRWGNAMTAETTAAQVVPIWLTIL